MSALLDTNILTRVAQPAHPSHREAVNAVDTLRGRGEDLCVLPQILIEFWVVATRPLSVNGLEMNTAQVEVELARIKSLFRLLPDTPAIFPELGKACGAERRFRKECPRRPNSRGNERSRHNTNLDVQRRRLQTLFGGHRNLS